MMQKMRFLNSFIKAISPRSLRFCLSLGGFCILSFALGAQASGGLSSFGQTQAKKNLQEIGKSEGPSLSQLNEMGVTEHLGETISLDTLRFRDEKNQPVELSQFFQKGRPVLLTLVYYKCPHLCNFMLDGLVKALKTLDWTVGGNFEIVTVSINPNETGTLASQKKDAYIRAYGRMEASKSWHFLTGDNDQIQQLASEVGFGFQYDEKSKEYGHSAVLFVLTPEGKISRYLYGIDFKNRDLKLAFLEASSGGVGTVIDRLQLFCYRYDPDLRRYSVYLTRLMQTSGVLTLLVLGGYLGLFWRRQRKGA